MVAHTGLRDLKVSINVSPMQAARDEFYSSLLQTVERYGVPPSRIELEITESALVEPKKRITANLARLQKAGFTVALDDFGTGYSSLSYLNRLPIDTLKIDRSFMKNSGTLEGRAVVAAVVALGKALGKEIVAEGVETQHQLDWLRTIGCEEVQGFFSHPRSQHMISRQRFDPVDCCAPTPRRKTFARVRRCPRAWPCCRARRGS